MKHLVALTLITAGLVASAGGLDAQPLPPAPNKTVVVFFENKNYDEIVASCCAPYLNSLIRAGASLQFWGFHHPSQPNYFEFFAGTTALKMLDGSTVNVWDDRCISSLDPQPPGSKVQSLSVTPTLGDAFGDQFIGYAEGYDSSNPSRCSFGDEGAQPDQPQLLYATRHCPWTAFASLQDNGSGSLAPFTNKQFQQLTTLSMVTPDIYDDMHSPSTVPPPSPPGCNCRGEVDQMVLQGDTWLQQTLDPYVQWAKTNDSLLVVTWDEDNAEEREGPDIDGARYQWPQNHIATILVGPMVIPGSTGYQPYNHYDLLRTILQLHGKPPIGGATTANLIQGIWNVPPPPTRR
ncbi:MAG TPA: alkaline phosphatase family protein [Thermoanaerobaculia bacterium]